MQKIQAFLNLMTMKKEREERVRITSPFTVGVAGLALSMDSKGRIGC